MSDPSLVPMLAQVRMPQGHMWGWGVAWMWLWGLVVIALIVALVVAVVWALTRVTGPRDDARQRARAILDERYARGELSTDEYREAVDVLR